MFSTNLMIVKYKKCSTCKKGLNENNESGYCTLCYRKNPKYLEYQRLYQRVLIQSPKIKATRTKYYEKHKDEIREYQKKYQEEHKDKIRKQKTESKRRRRKNDNYTRIKLSCWNI
jgi:hypothetical protein